MSAKTSRHAMSLQVLIWTNFNDLPIGSHRPSRYSPARADALDPNLANGFFVSCAQGC